MDMEIKEINVRDLRTNSGQIAGLPRNPRKISKKQLEKLKKSVADAPEMLQLRELIVVENGNEFVVIAGNQRLEAAKAIGMKSVPCKVLAADTPAEKLREYAIKDNLPFGEDDWEVLNAEWDKQELEDWGMSVKEAKQNEESTIYDSPIQFLPGQEYILVICEDAFEFDEAREHFGCGLVKKDNIKGQGRIVKSRTVRYKDYVNRNTKQGETSKANK